MQPVVEEKGLPIFRALASPLSPLTGIFSLWEEIVRNSATLKVDVGPRPVALVACGFLIHAFHPAQ